MSAAGPGHRAALPLFTVVLVAGAACRTPSPDPGEGACGESDCDVAQTRAELEHALVGLQDPMARWLLQSADELGGIDGDFRTVLEGVGGEVGCDATTERAFVVLSNQELQPKAIVTRCVDDPVTASSFFMVIEPGPDGDDLDLSRVRVAAWDPEAARYHRYQMLPRAGDDGLAVTVEPAFCASCHGGPFHLEPWTPIMNEMTNPWAQWNAEPGFASYQFDDAFAAAATGPAYAQVTAQGRLDSASNLEPVIRAAIGRTTNARLAPRTDAPDLEVALSLLRPVFCDESVNFVSEIHDSGEIEAHAVVDPGLRRAMLALAGDEPWPWAWVTASTVRIPAPSPGDTPLAMIAVRGETTVQAELSLLSRQVLQSEQILRVRALDWTRPVFSGLRCSLWEAAAVRARAGAVDPSGHGDNAALVSALYDEAMQLQVGDTLVPLRAATEAEIIAIADVEHPAAVAALSEGDLTALELTPTELGEAVHAHLADLQVGDARARLEAERQRRGCLARKTFVIAPLVPGLEACA